MTADVTRQSLLARLDALSYGERVRHVVELARSGETGPKALALIDTLLAGDAYEASLAVEMARAVRDVHRLAAALDHRSFGVRRSAAAYLVRLVPDVAPVPADSPDKPPSPAVLDLPALIHGLAPALRRAALKGLVRSRRRAAAQALFPDVLTRHGPREAAVLLPALAPADLRVHLPALAHAAPAWRALLLRHPDITIDHLRHQLTAAPQRDRPGVWTTHRPLVSALAELRPAALHDLLAEFPDTCSPWSLHAHLGDLTRDDPARTLVLLERQPMRELLLGQGLPRRLLNQVVRLPDDLRVRLGRVVGERPEHLAELLQEVAPSRRAALFDAVYADHDRELRDWPEKLLDSLPHALRRQEAARMLLLPAVATDPDRVLALTAHLPLAVAAATLHPATRSADASERGRALALWLTCAARDVPHTLTTTLEQVAQRLRNEQDPVRVLVVLALRLVPASRFTPADADALRTIARQASEARDLSWSARNDLLQLAFKLLRAHAAAADAALFTAGLDIVVLLAGQRGSLNLPDLSHSLPQKTAPALLAALAPRLAAASDRERPDLIFALAAALGERGHDLPALTELLEPLTAAKPDHVASRAVTLLLADPRGRDERVRRLIAADRSAIALQPVLDHLHLRRQAWLDPFLDGSKISGRFLSGKTVHLVPVTAGFHRWLPRQQHALAALIQRLGGDKGHDQLTRAAVIQRLAALPVTTVADFEPFLRDPEVPVVEAALAALAWIDSPADALPVLLEHLDGDRARVAMYAVPRVARFIPADTLAHSLVDLLSVDRPRKLTVRKEAIRLLGVHRTPRSLPALFELLARPDLPRDLAIAVGHAARNLLDDPRAIGLLAPLACSPDPDIARSVLGPSPAHLPAQARPAYARLVLATARHPDLKVRRAAYRVLATWSLGQEDEVAATLADVILDLERGAAWTDAAVALVAVCSEHGAALAPVARVLAALAARADDPGPDPARDLPARQRLFAVVDALVARERPTRLALGTALAELAAQLPAPDLWPRAAALRLASLDLESPAADAPLRALAEDPLADVFLDDLVTALEHQAVASAAPALLARAAALPTSPVAARLAVSLVEIAGDRLEWPAPAVAALAALRGHPDPRIRAAARAAFTRPEA